MPTRFTELSYPEAWNVLVAAALRALEAEGFQLERVPGRGKSNIWRAEKGGIKKRVSIRTTRDRWFTFQPLNNGTRWKSLDDVDLVVVAAVNCRQDPRKIEVYQFDAKEVRQRFDACYAARKQTGQTPRDNFGMWVGLDLCNSGLPKCVGSGLANKYDAIATYSMSEFTAEMDAPTDQEADVDNDNHKSEMSVQGHYTIAEILGWARQRIASISGVRIEAVKLDCRIES